MPASAATAPVGFDRILGQSRAKDVLRGAIDAGRVHHAWIFHGPRGVGKFTTAVEFARVLLDPEAAPDETGRLAANPAGETSRLIDRDAHPDLHVIRKELALTSSVKILRGRKLTNIPIDLLREHVIGGETQDGGHHAAAAFLKPRRGHHKVFVIDEAELLDGAGQNALLKTLEEPPAGTHLILLTTQENRLLPTIRSRCQRVAFGPLPETEMRSWVERERANADSPLARPSEDEMAWLLRFAGGSPGLALLAAREGLHEWRREITPMLRDLQRGAYPADLGETLAGLVDRYATNKVKELENASKEIANREGADLVFLLLADHARARLAHALETDDEPEIPVRLIDEIADAERSVARHVNLKHVMENLVAQWATIVDPKG